MATEKGTSKAAKVKPKCEKVYECEACGGHCELHTSGALMGSTYAKICPIDAAPDAAFVLVEIDGVRREASE